jgi:DNA-binding CsgD family transcriptional regulator
MGAVEHLKTLCCLGLPPESAMMAIVPLLREIIPHGWARIGLIDPDFTIRVGYLEHPDAEFIFRERIGKFLDDPTSLVSLRLPALHAVGIGWTLHRQGAGYLETAYYRELEDPLDSCWVLDAMIGDDGRTHAGLQLTRPRSARPFTVADVCKLDRLRPWISHGLRRDQPFATAPDNREIFGGPCAPMLRGQMILTTESSLVFQTPGTDMLRVILNGETWTIARPPRAHRVEVPLRVKKIVQQIVGAATGAADTTPRMQISTRYGMVTLEANWLVPAGVCARDAARDPKSCLVAVTLELRQHPIAHAARVLRESGATPAQVKVGTRLVMGKTKQAIADDIDLHVSTVASLTKKLYQKLDVHNSADLGAKIWFDEIHDSARRN